MMWREHICTQLDALRNAHRWREPIVFDGDGIHGTVRDHNVIAFASNDYLGLSQHPAVRAAAHEAIDRFGAGTGASRLVVGSRSVHAELEAAIAAWKHTDAALLFPNGYAANLGALSALGGPDVTLFSDELNHASIIDGCRLSRSRVVVYRHGDMNHLSELLKTASGRKLIVSDAVFSMDGDMAPLPELVELCVRHDALLMLDEAHAVLGPELLDAPIEMVRMGTLSKALGSLGGWIAGSRDLIDLLINHARSFIFTTALSPADTAASLAALRIYRSPEGDALRKRLRRNIERLRADHPSPIVPWILGDDRAALDAAAHLLSRNIFIPAIRPPTVPQGAARLRIALSALHTDEMIDQLLRALAHPSCTPLAQNN